MTGRTFNGIITFDGGTTIIDGQVAAGQSPVINITESAQATFPEHNTGTDIGVITAKPEEAQAVRQVLALRPDDKRGVSFDVGTINTGGRAVTVIAIQALSQGQDAAVSAVSCMREYFSPKIIVLAGIAGGIHPSIHLGDVVIATHIICYDLRKETPGQTLHRGQERQAPAEIGHAVNQFFATYGEPAHVADGIPGNAMESIRVLEGPIGSGNAVIAHRDSETVKYLLAFNDKTLAVDMESGGLSQAYHALPAKQRPTGWLVIRGISDHADERKDDTYQRIAASHAAIVLRKVLPYLPISPA